MLVLLLLVQKAVVIYTLTLGNPSAWTFTDAVTFSVTPSLLVPILLQLMHWVIGIMVLASLQLLHPEVIRLRLPSLVVLSFTA